MADREDRYSENVEGPFYTDTTCTDCDLCRVTAPATFTRHNVDGQTYVYRQPVTEEEIRMANEAMESCPTQTIGDDGA